MERYIDASIYLMQPEAINICLINISFQLISRIHRFLEHHRMSLLLRLHEKEFFWVHSSYLSSEGNNKLIYISDPPESDAHSCH